MCQTGASDPLSWPEAKLFSLSAMLQDARTTFQAQAAMRTQGVSEIPNTMVDEAKSHRTRHEFYIVRVVAYSYCTYYIDLYCMICQMCFVKLSILGINNLRNSVEQIHFHVSLESRCRADPKADAALEATCMHLFCCHMSAVNIFVMQVLYWKHLQI